MLKRVLFGCLLAIGLSGCAGGPALLGPSTGTVTGHVTLRACGGAYRVDQAACSSRPMAGATVSFRLTSGSGASREQTAVTDPSGAYRLELAPGTYTIALSSTGSSPQTSGGPAVPAASGAPRQVTVIAGKTVVADVAWTIQLL